ncbi:hypothetical protein Bxe_A3718 [Paraburkholderia xenovorans LB400]|uniref:Uncharacterized protein n=1 Tax=Paraburkholderia xenovorans (strain LB400) TaxID=266265 RepID=Q144G8_PARXL|nr:hypothetical protein Bxe_A3718 [Paraburkholderia xenovorans LB400]
MVSRVQRGGLHCTMCFCLLRDPIWTTLAFIAAAKFAVARVENHVTTLVRRSAAPRVSGNRRRSHCRHGDSTTPSRIGKKNECCRTA